MDFQSLLMGGFSGDGNTGSGLGNFNTSLGTQDFSVPTTPTNSAPINVTPTPAGGGGGFGVASAAPMAQAAYSSAGMGGGGTAGGAMSAAGGAGGAAAPGGASPIPQMNTLSGGGSVGAGLADSFKAIGNMIANVDTDKAVGQFTYAAQPPSYRVQPVLASFSTPAIR